MPSRELVIAFAEVVAVQLAALAAVLTRVVVTGTLLARGSSVARRAGACRVLYRGQREMQEDEDELSYYGF